jgi:hypothetical protein
MRSQVQYFFKHFHIFKPLRISHKSGRRKSEYSAKRLANPLRPPQALPRYAEDAWGLVANETKPDLRHSRPQSHFHSVTR